MWNQHQSPVAAVVRLRARNSHEFGGRLRDLWRDERGSATFVELILITATVALGGIVGLVAVRDQVAQEFGDVAVSLDQLDQSFSYAISVDANGDGDLTDPEDFILTAAYADPAPTLTDPVNAAPAGLVFGGSPTAEGGAITGPSGACP